MHELEQHAVGIAMHDALDRTVRVIADRIGLALARSQAPPRPARIAARSDRWDRPGRSAPPCPASATPQRAATCSSRRAPAGSARPPARRPDRAKFSVCRVMAKHPRLREDLSPCGVARQSVREADGAHHLAPARDLALEIGVGLGEVLHIGSKPFCASFSCKSGSFISALISALSLATTASGVLAGAKKPTHEPE